MLLAEIRHDCLDAAGGIEYRKWSIKPQSPDKGDFVQNKKLCEDKMAPAKETTLVIRKELERVCKEFTALIASYGFQRSKKMFWTRQHRYTVDFIYFFRSGSSYGAPYNYDVDIEATFGIRLLNDDLDGPHLNGPTSDGMHSQDRGAFAHHATGEKITPEANEAAA